MVSVIEKIVNEHRKRFGDRLRAIQFDEGSEFLNNIVKDYFKREGIEWFFTFSPRKAAVEERLNRTLKNKTAKMFEAHEDHKWKIHLEDIVENYNNSVHRSIGMKPSEVNDENKFLVWERLFGHVMQIKKPKYKIGDEVRVLKLNTHHRVAQLIYRREMIKFLEKSERSLGDYLKEKYKDKDEEGVLTREVHRLGKGRPPFSKEIFRIINILLGDPNVYKLYSDEAEVEVLGVFYAEELSLVKE